MPSFGRRLLALAALFILASPARAGDRDGGRLTVMSYNIRLDVASDGSNAWQYRRDLVFALIRHEAPDILGLQEVLLSQKRDLERALPEYAVIGAGRDDGMEKGEFSPLAYRRERFALIASGTFWLSENPTVPGKGWDAAFPRIVTWAMLRDRSSRKIIRVVNTHFDHVGTIARLQSASMLSRWLAQGEWAALPTIVTGDFNSGPGGDPHRLLTGGPARLGDARLMSLVPPYGPPGTFNGFKVDSSATEPIDHIFLSRAMIVEKYAVVTQQWEGRLPSDHYPVVSRIRLPKE